MLPHRLLHLNNGVIRSIIKSSSIATLRTSITTFTTTGRRNLSFLEPARPDPQHSGSITNSIPEPVAQPLEATIPEEDDDVMNAQRESELLAMQHVLGLKNAADAPLKLKAKELERLERLKAAEPVFVCVDLEAFEFAQGKITEVGVSILDSRHVVGTDPSADGSDWLSKITTRHMIIEEHKHLVNKRFVHGCPDKFNFGVSELVSLRHIRDTLTQLFDNPSPATLRASDQGSRKLILVGHGLNNDTAYLNKLNFKPHAKGNILQDVDTQRFVGNKKDTVGLSKLMIGLGVEAENLHNAGNDAAYTMQGLLLMVIQHTNDPGAYLKAVASAKAKLDPAKQRYKDHKAMIREKAAEQKARTQAASLTEQKGRQDPAASLTQQKVRQDPATKHTVESLFTVAGWKDTARSNAETEFKQHTGRASVQEERFGWTPINAERPPPSAAEELAKHTAGRRELKKSDGSISPHRVISLTNDNDWPPRSTNIDDSLAHYHASSSKRKSSDPEPIVPDRVEKSAKTQPVVNWDDDDEFSISPGLHSIKDTGSHRPPQNDESISELMKSETPYGGAPSVRKVLYEPTSSEFDKWLEGEGGEKSYTGPRRVNSRWAADDNDFDRRQSQKLSRQVSRYNHHEGSPKKERTG